MIYQRNEREISIFFFRDTALKLKKKIELIKLLKMKIIHLIISTS